MRYTTHTPDVMINKRVEYHIGKYDTLMGIVKSKLAWFGHVVRANGTLANTISHGEVEGERSRGKPARQWLEDVHNGQGWALMRCEGSQRTMWHVES